MKTLSSSLGVYRTEGLDFSRAELLFVGSCPRGMLCPVIYCFFFLGGGGVENRRESMTASFGRLLVWGFSLKDLACRIWGFLPPRRDAPVAFHLLRHGVLLAS